MSRHKVWVPLQIHPSHTEKVSCQIHLPNSSPNAAITAQGSFGTVYLVQHKEDPSQWGYQVVRISENFPEIIAETKVIYQKPLASYKIW